MPELRKDPVIGRWVIIAAERGDRPMDFIQQEQKTIQGLCPFCPGAEDKTLEPILVFPSTNGGWQNKQWLIRVVPNKYPALAPGKDPAPEEDGIYVRMNGTGAHEVVIESPEHDLSIADFDLPQVERIVHAYKERMAALRDDTRLHYILIFKNHGREAGASLNHPHSQIVGLPIVPKRLKEELAGAGAFFTKNSRCVFCEIIQQERKSGIRVIVENEDFIAIAPYASRAAYETWILPKQHQSHFETIEEHKIVSFASLLKDVLFRIKTHLNDPAYNFMLHTSPLRAPGDEFPYYHWRLEIAPKITKAAGFEWGTGFYINTMPPEKAAESLRKV